MNHPDKITIYGSRSQNENAEKLRNFVLSLVFECKCVSMHEKLYDYLTCHKEQTLPGVLRVSACPPDAQLALSIGGDGTFLRTVAWTSAADIPILGINSGHLGYLTALSLDEAAANGNILDLENFRTEKLAMIQVESDALPSSPSLALNEVVMAKEDSASMITAAASLDGSPLALYKADGLIIATPTGSTAYNLSVGGPIVQPSAPVLIVSPIAAHSLTLRPLVVNDMGVLAVRVEGRGHHFRLVIDGRAHSLPMGSSLTVRRAERTVTALQPACRNFAGIIGEKLLFNG